jgi:hypothetical protein
MPRAPFSRSYLTPARVRRYVLYGGRYYSVTQELFQKIRDEALTGVPVLENRPGVTPLKAKPSAYSDPILEIYPPQRQQAG